MHDPVGPDDLGPEGLADALVTQADAQDGYPGGEPLDGRVRDPGLSRGARPRRDDQVGRVPGLDLVEADLVIADDQDVEAGVDLAEPLDQVIGERVVIVDQHDREVRAVVEKDGRSIDGPAGRDREFNVTRLGRGPRKETALSIWPAITAPATSRLMRCGSIGWHFDTEDGAMVSMVGSVTLLIAMSSTGGIFFHRDPNNHVAPPLPGYGAGFRNDNPDGYGFHNFGLDLPLYRRRGSRNITSPATWRSRPPR